MTGARRVLLACVLLGAGTGAAGTGVSGQRTARVTLGGALGPAVVPGVLSSGCAGPGAQIGGAGADLRGSVTVRRSLRLETRVGGVVGMDFQECKLVVTPLEEGLGVTRGSLGGHQGSISTDARVRFDAGPGVLTAGLGQLWAAHAPYVVLGPGLRLGERPFKLILDGDVLLMRLPYDSVTTEWHAYTPVREVSRVRHHELRKLLAARLGLELRLP